MHGFKQGRRVRVLRSAVEHQGKHLLTVEERDKAAQALVQWPEFEAKMEQQRQVAVIHPELAWMRTTAKTVGRSFPTDAYLYPTQPPVKARLTCIADTCVPQAQ